MQNLQHSEQLLVRSLRLQMRLLVELPFSHDTLAESARMPAAAQRRLVIEQPDKATSQR